MRSYDECRAEAIAAEARGDLTCALRAWSQARMVSPNAMEAACREIELLLQSKQYETANVRMFTALQKFSDQPRLVELEGVVEDSQLGHHELKARRALESGDRATARFHYEMACCLQKHHKHRNEYLDLAREVAPEFEQMLADIDGRQPKTRIYIMGCGRSGTFLLTCLMEWFEDTYVLPDEVQAGRFARLHVPERIHVLKRNSHSPLVVDYLSPKIHVLYLVRFPLDVLVSNHLGHAYFMVAEVWKRHTDALRRLVVSARPNLKVVRYEDLVRWPDELQRAIGRHYGLTIRRPFSNFPDGLALNHEVDMAMNGIRPIDAGSIGRWRSEAAHIDHCRRIWPDIREHALWLCDAFGYEVPTELEPAGNSVRLPEQEGASLNELQFKFELPSVG